MLVFMPLFYGLILPGLIFLFSYTTEILNKKNTWTTASNRTQQEDSEEEYKEYLKQEIQNELDDALEINEDKKDSLLADMYRLVAEGKYQKVIDFNNSFDALFDYLKDTDNMSDISVYCLLVWASYQEIGNLEIADKYYDVFLRNLSLDSHTIQVFEENGIDKVWAMKMMLLVKRLEELGISYKLPAEEVERAEKKQKKKKKNKSKRER